MTELKPIDVKLAPSLLSADFGALAKSAEECDLAGAEFLHFNVMDGSFVPNITFGERVVKSLRRHSRSVFDVHLMIDRPERYVEEFVLAGADIVTIHVEATTHVQRTLSLIRSFGVRAGLALNPGTPLNVLDYLLDDIDLLLIMTVNPGFGGQSFIPASLKKIADAKERLLLASHPIELEVDGGIGSRNAREVVAAGATVLVAGTSVFGHHEGPTAGVKALRTVLE